MIRRLALMLALALPAQASEPCMDDTPCALGDRSYHVKEPDGWDGVSPLPVLLHFHGWGRQGDLIVKHRRISGATRRRGVLLVAPNGRGGSWDFWRAGSGDVGFARAVLEDVATRYPIENQPIFVSGYSFGGAMAWRFVCEDGADIAALLAISGSLPQVERCETTPAEVRHVHGLADTVMDFPFGPGGDVLHPVKLWRDAMGCDMATPKGDWQAVPFLALSRTTWEDCEQGRVTLDVHPGGHFIPHGWIGWQLDQLMRREPEYP